MSFENRYQFTQEGDISSLSSVSSNLSDPFITESITTTSNKPKIIPELDDEERAELIGKISARQDIVDSITWALLWLADIERLRVLVALEPRFLDRALLANENKCRVLAWATRTRSNDDDVTDPNADASINPGPSNKRRKKNPDDKERNSKLPKMTNERDGGCVLTRADEALEGAHIYPFSLTNQPKRDQKNFWSMLSYFWSPDKVDKWKKEIMGEAGTEFLGNMICLNKYAHGLWGKARFVLEPLELSEDKCSLPVRFWWLPIRRYSEKVPINTPPSISSSMTQTGTATKLWNHLTEQKLCSGDEILLTTPDAAEYPLPSVELLRMSWNLTRVLAMSGAADILPDAEDSDSEDDSDVEEAVMVDVPEASLVEQPRGRLQHRQSPRRGIVNMPPARSSSRGSTETAPLALRPRGTSK
ncbi:HNH endonuclease signature motif containing protein [Aspergillus mulundensis]|uniref:HNH nuclease domain-containing protein n=1 Tax=Aspergillus mulundensis TaxID=1810919 RepID=A0A3D8QH71_9EURO|nr:hypothetical protein DSM5745_10670 [Aspergillus mulundensis]RDW61172.1 hypothetical protein DSM5745_10670 [Aspergillus mulundensis]